MRFVSHWPFLMPLLFLAYLPGGTRPGRGSRKPSVFTDTRGHGMRSVTFTGRRLTAGACSFSSLRGRVSAVLNRPYRESPLVRRVSSYTVLGSSGDGTATPGASGEPLERVASDDRQYEDYLQAEAVIGARFIGG